MQKTARQILLEYLEENDIKIPIQGSVRAFCADLAADHELTANAFRHVYYSLLDDLDTVNAELDDAGSAPEEQASKEIDEEKDDQHQDVKIRHKGQGETLAAADNRDQDWFELDEDDQLYVFRISKTLFSMSYREIEDMVAAYVHEGGGLTQVQVARLMWRRHRRKLTADFVRRIFAVLGIVKHNPPLAPHVVRNTDPDEASDIWHEQKLAEIETKYRAKSQKKLEAALKEEREKSLRFEDLAAEYLGDQDRKVIALSGGAWDKRPERRYHAPHTAIVCLADWHVGKISEAITCEADHRAMVDRLIERLCDHFAVENQRAVERLIFAIAGDVLDGTQGDMHEGQYLGQWCFGRTQGDIAAETLALVIEGLSQRLGIKSEAYTVTGNHDRTSKGRDGDPLRTVGGMVYLLARERSPSCAWTIIDDRVARFTAGGTGFLLAHGDKTPKDPRALFHGLAGEYQAVITGHLHSHRFAEDYRGFWFQVGSLVGVDDYARDEIGKGALPSQLVISCREGLPPVSTYLPL